MSRLLRMSWSRLVELLGQLVVLFAAGDSGIFWICKETFSSFLFLYIFCGCLEMGSSGLSLLLS